MLRPFQLECNGLSGEVVIPADKSILQRALIIAAISQGKTSIYAQNNSEDLKDSYNCIKSLISPANCMQAQEGYVIQGVSRYGIGYNDDIVNFGNSATLARLVVGLLSTYNKIFTFSAHDNLKKRSMLYLIDMLKQNGAEFYSNDCKFPFVMKGASAALPIKFLNHYNSAQLKSAALLAGINTPGITEIVEECETRNHTEILLSFFGARVQYQDRMILLEGYPELKGQSFSVPGDPSSAAFLILAALIIPNSQITIKDVLFDKVRLEFVSILQKMGGKIAMVNIREGEPFSKVDIQVAYSVLNGIEIEGILFSKLIDEYIVLSVACAFAKTKSVIKNLTHGLVNKESDRAQGILLNLRNLGVECEVRGEDIMIYPGSLSIDKGQIFDLDDHRILIAFVIAHLAIKGKVIVSKPYVANKSYPEIWKNLLLLNVKKSSI
ncbi:3-phosphoshikimate 1-carboxyvinyltransferase [Rickettsiales endosymbiont of Stachyamoeba lipophora]|uniref:3-phosphoshikimate 1-carboxyvinyltransferase n=1 Tax=Rickettsiales endosymbiont of Stachyamoeba lipophora TaxID=2486578 RepID=UPI000F648AD4|nr:3-phosphoshikimate 1-carboxyvinyltransferase [Rickettsiales endosymbiont of Stachyamoeba lipophora]AZL15858.1 3-phosphoshikimate 1-carboxyvinyltransferase [Rickettsiales endosymbiont of Stachyamoeba lipophora]